MSNIQAFPREGSDFAPAQDGMNLRDYFAAQAMGALIHETLRRTMSWPQWCEFVSERAYLIADTMLVEREKPPPPKFRGQY